MNTLVCKAPRQLEYRQAAEPDSKRGFSIIKITRIGICGTDLHAFEGTQPYFDYPRILGHELAGEFVSGDAEGISPGEAVTIIPYYHCGVCPACRKGRTNCCSSMRVCGVHTDGGMVEYLSVPSKNVLGGRNLKLDELALVEPLAISAHGIKRAGAEGEWVLITGAGPIGLGLAEFSVLSGARVIVVDVNEGRLQFCRNSWSSVHTVNARIEDTMQAVKELTSGQMASVVIDATGNLGAINNAFSYLAHAGTYVLVGLQKGEISFSHPAFHKLEGTLMSSRNATLEDFHFVMKEIETGSVESGKYISHKTTFLNVKDEFESWLNPQTGLIKVMVEVE